MDTDGSSPQAAGPPVDSSARQHEASVNEQEGPPATSGKGTKPLPPPTTTPGAPTVAAEKRLAAYFDEPVKGEIADLEVTELLGSVTTHNCPGTRTSARVIQKMKQDQIRPCTPPLNERDAHSGRKDEKLAVQKTPSAVRGGAGSSGANSAKPSWTNLERNHFFDALNEFGKDFDAIGNYINTKLKRKCATDVAFKTKDQVRQHYYQTHHKICKYMKFSDEVKKPAQELYALINYGEMRRKLQFVSDKHFIKLRSLVYQGHITVRCKGKNIRVKTPSCKALRRLNQLDDTLEDIRLPSKIEVIVTPATMEAFGRVQTIAQNPRVRTTVPLHKKLVNFIKTFQYKWRSPELRLIETEPKLFPPPTVPPAVTEANGSSAGGAVTAQPEEKPFIVAFQDPEMCFLPKPGVTVHRPLLSITEYLSSVNICLAAYEERMGVKVRGETLERQVANGKRQRTESGSDKRSPDTKKPKVTPSVERASGCGVGADSLPAEFKSESSGDELLDEINELLSDCDLPVKEEPASIKEEPEMIASKTDYPPTVNSVAPPLISSPATATAANSTPSATRAKRRTLPTATTSARAALIFKPLLSEEVVRRIRKGWTVSSAADITIGDLYVALGQDSKLELDYYWTAATAGLGAATTTASTTLTVTAPAPLNNETSGFAQKQNGMPYNASDCDDPQLLRTLAGSTVANKLKHLLLIANLSERIRKRQCSCGHNCERSAAKPRFDRDLATKTFISAKTYKSAACGGADGSDATANALFRQPIAPLRRPVHNLDPVKQLTTLTRAKMSRPQQVLVQRLLLPGGGAQPSYEPPDSQRRASSSSSSSSKWEPYLNGSEETPKRREGPPTPANFEGAVKACAATNTIDSTPTALLAPSSACQHDEASSKTSPVASPSLPDSAFDDISLSNSSLFNGMMASPMHLLRESQSSNSRWLEENLNDFSLTSLLGHLDEINASRDLLDPSSNLSVISESSVDFMHKFQEITASMRNQDKD